MIGLPIRFDAADVEHEFLTQYRTSGLRFVRLALLLGAGLAVVFFVLVLSVRDDEFPTNPRQALRLGLFLMTTCTAILVAWRPGWVVNHYELIVGGAVFASCLAIGAMSLLPADADEPRSGRWTVAMSLTCWLAYGFTRLPARVAAAACVLGSTAILISARVYSDEYVRALFVYLLMANLIGWIMSVEIERRERALFWSSRQLAAATRALEEMARNAADADSAKTRVLAAVSHDLRQPLASLALYSQLLRARNDVLGPAGLSGTVDRLDACVSALSGNLDRLSELGGLRDRGAPVPVTTIDLGGVLDRLESVYSAEAARRGARLVVRRPRPGRQFAVSNEHRLWDALSNLTGNALKFSSPDRGAWVLIRVRRSGTRLVVEVRDNGIGIAAADQRRVFDEYFQVANHARNPEHGHGLGLSIVREAVSRMPGHSLELWSRPGHGTRFALTMPAATPVGRFGSPGAEASPLGAHGTAGAASRDVEARADAQRCEMPVARYLAGAPADRGAEAQRAPEQVGGALLDGRLAGAYVLFIEDDDSMRDALGQVLRQWGVLVDVASSGEDALALAAQAERSFDAIVSDFRLPGTWDGLRLIDELRRLEGRRTPAILLSGEFRVEALRDSAPEDVHVMAKPPGLTRLRELLTVFAEGSGAVRA